MKLFLLLVFFVTLATIGESTPKKPSSLDKPLLNGLERSKDQSNFAHNRLQLKAHNWKHIHIPHPRPPIHSDESKATDELRRPDDLILRRHRPHKPTRRPRPKRTRRPPRRTTRRRRTRPTRRPRTTTPTETDESTDVPSETEEPSDTDEWYE